MSPTLKWMTTLGRGQILPQFGDVVLVCFHHLPTFGVGAIGFFIDDTNWTRFVLPNGVYVQFVFIIPIFI